MKYALLALAAFGVAFLTFWTQSIAYSYIYNKGYVAADVLRAKANIALFDSAIFFIPIFIILIFSLLKHRSTKTLFTLSCIASLVVFFLTVWNAQSIGLSLTQGGFKLFQGGEITTSGIIHTLINPFTVLALVSLCALLIKKFKNNNI